MSSQCGMLEGTLSSNTEVVVEKDRKVQFREDVSDHIRDFTLTYVRWPRYWSDHVSDLRFHIPALSKFKIITVHDCGYTCVETKKHNNHLISCSG
jgi:hypothetical protein